MAKDVANNTRAFKAKGRWFRVYAEIINDPKVQKLPAHLFRTWINILALAAEDDGKLPSTDDIAFRLRMSPKDAEGHVCDLIDCGLIDIAPDRSLSPHNWCTRQYRWDGIDRTNAQRQKRHRNSRRNGRVTDGVTQNRSVSVSDTSLEDRNRSIHEGKIGSSKEDRGGCAADDVTDGGRS